MLLLSTALLSACSVVWMQKQGSVSPETFHYKTRFTTKKSLIILPVELNGQMKNFIFDTGAEVSLLQRDTVEDKNATIGGASNREMEVGKEIVSSFRIGDIEFQKTYAMTGNFVGLKENIDDFGGLIGQPVIGKANWLIDYRNKRLEIGSGNLIDSTYTALKLEKDDGKGYVSLMIDGKPYRTLVDLGSTTAFSIPEESELAAELLERYDFHENKREIYTIGGLQQVNEQVGILEAIELDGLVFRNIPVSIRQTSQMRVGNDFFKNCCLYIDNTHDRYCVKQLP